MGMVWSIGLRSQHDDVENRVLDLWGLLVICS